MAVGSAIIAGLALGYGVYSGEEQSRVQKVGLRRQKDAQDKAERDASVQARQAEEGENRARQKSPDLGVLLADVAGGFRPSQGSVNADRLLLGRPGLLGA